MWHPMRRLFLPALIAGLLMTQAAPAGAQGDGTFFPYLVQKKTLPNGLDILVIPMPAFKDVLSYNTLILAGARNETEKGKSGLAHLFEHLMFRHMWQGVPLGYEHAISEMGAFNNAWTWFDVTFFHPVTFASNLAELARLEADQFKALTFTEEIFKTEAGAVLGEYRNNASDPGLRMDEVLLGQMYGTHGYGHTTIGYLDDVKDMPNEYQAALAFHDTYYRPNNAVVLVAGDVEPEKVFDLLDGLYGDWEPKPVAEQPDPAPVGGPKEAHVEWEVSVPPRVTVSYRMPAFRTGTKETAAGQLLPGLLVGETAPLYVKMRYTDRLVQDMGMAKDLYESFDQGHLDIGTVLFQDRFEQEGDAYFNGIVTEVQAGMEELAHFSSRPDAAEQLESLKSRYRYDMLAQLDSPAATAETFVLYYRFERDPLVLDHLVASVEALTPQDIDRFASEWLIPANRVVVTMNGPKGKGGGHE